MNGSVKLNYQFFFRAIKIDYKISNTVLPPELPVFELSVLQRLPKECLGRSESFPKLPYSMFPEIFYYEFSLFMILL